MRGLPAPGDDLPARAAAEIRRRTPFVPTVAVIAGSGLGSIFDRLEFDTEVAYTDLPGFPAPSVPGHAGRLMLGTLDGVPLAAFAGRFHLYEGHPPAVPALLPRLAHALGARTIVVTAAAGAIAEELDPGHIVVLRDHLNFLREDPLRGWRRPDGSPAFVELSEVYDAGLGAGVLAAGRALGCVMASGVYAAVPGPSFETPAEAGFLRRAGADVVGMSVVPETVPAYALGLRVLGLTCVTNRVGTAVDHADVVRVSGATGASIAAILARTLGDANQDGPDRTPGAGRARGREHHGP